ncbi:MAG: transcription antitermination factor NusB [Deltaproteobacteria bacterium]|nr:transcription antitermination factor NusB [Deltaproteobacteria bacterium]MDL1960492.1 transcription antitermination factor NusB [Deltaproteobacteria bacterium]
MPKLSVRRKGREIALQILYQCDWDTIEDIDKAVTEYATGLASEAIPENDPALEFGRTRLQGVLTHKAKIDSILQRNTKRWRLERMASVDRNILRIGTFELCYCPDIPPKVAINEALELAKKFCSGESSAFVNGILDAVLREREKKQKT